MIYRRAVFAALSSTLVAAADMKGQSFNAKAVLTLAKVILKPSLAVPHMAVPHIGHVDFQALRNMGVKGVVFDKDNTLTAPYIDKVHDAVKEGFNRCTTEFEGMCCIMSNSAGTADDVGYKMAERIERSIGIPVVRHAVKKPGGLEEVLQFFSEQSGEEVRSEELCVIGDRLLTDVVFGNLYGMVTVHTQPLTLAGDNKVAMVARYVEQGVWGSLLHKRLGVEAPPRHKPTL
ncbi:unnamed protein product [Chrysoparadoxa australica]